MRGDRREARNLSLLLWDTVDPENREQVAADLAFVTSLFDPVPKFRLFLEAPQIAPARKREVISRVLGPVISPPVMTFIEELIERRRAGYLPAISEQFQARADEASGRVHGEVVSAYPVPPQIVDRLAEHLGERLDREVILHPRVDQAVLGGLRVHVGDILIDGTVRRRLNELNRRLSDRRRRESWA